MADLFAEIEKLSLFVIEYKSFSHKRVERFFESSFVERSHRDNESGNIGHSFDRIFGGVCKLEKFRVKELLTAFLEHREGLVDGYWECHFGEVASNGASEGTHNRKL